MQKSVKWSYAPYKPYFFEGGDIYVSRIAPNENEIHFEWLCDCSDAYNVYIRVRDEGEYTCYKGITGGEYTATNLLPNTDYEFYVERDGKKSRVRLARTGKLPTSVGEKSVPINYLHKDDRAYSFSGNYLASPSFVRHPDGYLLASMDIYGPDAPQNLTLIYRSDDNGETWHYQTDLFPCFWGKMFIHNGEVYMLSVSNEYGDLLIGKSKDGKEWDAPTVLMRGSCSNKEAGCHKNPQPLVRFNGRIYNSMEWGAWKCRYHAPMVMSIDENADLLDASNWSFSQPIKYDPTWEGVAVGESTGNIEGSLVVAPNGKLYNIMRYDTSKTVPNYGLILAFEVNTQDHTAPLKYDRAIKFDGNLSKFTIKYDQVTGYYYTLMTRIWDSGVNGGAGDRRLLTLARSKDLDNWENVEDIFDHRKIATHREDGFQYVDWEFEGNDIIFFCRTAINNANSFHDSNYILFSKIKNFRNL